MRYVPFWTLKLQRHSRMASSRLSAKQLGLSDAAGAALLSTLVDEGYIDNEKLTPTTLGMALAQAEDRERLPLDRARVLLDEFLDAVKTVNARPGARIFIERVHVFGSFLVQADTVGDIDLLLEAPLPDDCGPEDMDEHDAVMEEINISDYLVVPDLFKCEHRQGAGLSR